MPAWVGRFARHPTGVAAILLLPAGAMAQPRPLVQPTRDVTVTYQVDGAARQAIPGGIDGPLRLSWDAAGQRLRADSPSRPQAVIVDLPKRTATVLDPALRAALPLPVRERSLKALALDGVQLARRGPGSAAGLACTTWAVHAEHGDGTVCLTPDGVALRGEGTVDGRRGSFVATDVTYGAVAPDLFKVPGGYLSLSFSNFGRHP